MTTLCRPLAAAQVGKRLEADCDLCRPGKSSPLMQVAMCEIVVVSLRNKANERVWEAVVWRRRWLLVNKFRKEGSRLVRTRSRCTTLHLIQVPCF